MKKGQCLASALLLVLILESAVSAYDVLIVNSENWVDAYSGSMYANLADKPFAFLTTGEQAMRLPATLSGKSVYLIESESVPVVSGYTGTLKSKGFDVDTEVFVSGKDLNLQLAKKLDTRRFIIVDDTYGYNAISVTPYAVLTRAYVLFTDKDNIDAVYDFLKERDASILIYGHLDSEARERLKDFSAEVIDSGDKFDDNIEIVERYRKTRDVEQVSLSSGDFMEPGLMRGVEPILFIGADTPVDQTAEYVKSSGIKVGVLVGDGLVTSAQTLKAKTGISIFMKFGQGFGAGAGSAEIVGLDYFAMPSYPLNVTVRDIAYNILTDELEVVYYNAADAFAYIKSTIRVYAGETLAKTVGDADVMLLNAGEERGVTYPLDLSEYDIKKLGLRTEVFVQYGEGKKSLGKNMEDNAIVRLVEVEDTSSIDARALTYDADREVLVLTVKNMGPSCYVKPTITLANGNAIGIDAASLAEGETKAFEKEVRVSSTELEANKKVAVVLEYGLRKSFLGKRIDMSMDLSVQKSMDMSQLYPLVIILLLIVIAAMAFLILRKKAPEDGEEEKKD